MEPTKTTPAENPDDRLMADPFYVLGRIGVIVTRHPRLKAGSIAGMRLSEIQEILFQWKQATERQDQAARRSHIGAASSSSIISSTKGGPL